MMVKKSDENSRALALIEKVGENFFLARTTCWPVYILIYFSVICCITLIPYPTVNVIRYNIQSFTCSVDPNWSSVIYSHCSTNMAFFSVQDGKCKDAAPSSGLYTTDCDDSTRTFYLTINNVNKGNNKITELRTILQRESQNS